VCLLAAAVLVVRRWRLARDLVVAGALAWLTGRLVGFVVQRTDLATAFRVTLDLTNAPHFAHVRVAMVVAAVTVASPHLTRPTRAVGQGLVALLALTALYLGRSGPTDLLAAIALGWGVAAAVHFLFGTPNRRPTAPQVQAALDQLGLGIRRLRLAPTQPVGRAVFFGEDSGGTVRVTALGRDEGDAQFLARAWRFVAYRDAPPVLYPTRRQQVEFEAYVELLATSSGVRAPAVVLAGRAGALALLVERLPSAVRLFDMRASAVTDDLLADAWEQVRLLRDAKVVHGRLDGQNVGASSNKAFVDGFDHASTSLDRRDRSTDVAQLLAATAAVAGDDRAAAAAVKALGAGAVAAALASIQPQLLSGWTHDALGGRDGLEERLEKLRAAGARAAGINPPELRAVYRVHPRNIVLTVAAVLGVAALLSQVGDPAKFWSSLRDATWEWVALGCVIGLMTDVTFGITFLGNVPGRIPVWPSIELQSAMSFSNLAVPVAADAALQVRFLQKNGMDLSSAVASGGFLSAASEIAVQLGLLFLGLSLSPDEVRFGRIDTSQMSVIALTVVFALGVLTALLLGIRRLREAVLPPVKRALRTVWAAVKTPARLALLIGGNIAAQCLYVASLLVCLLAFGVSANFWTLLAVNIGVSLIASLVPFPGGGNVVSVVGTAGILHALGLPAAAASAGVLAQQVAVTFVPAVPGWFATRDLLRKNML
jgi:undecaprenyl-diphosphatase